MQRTNIPLNTAVGDRELCAWQPVRGIVWVQTRDPNHARRLARRKDGRLVVRGVAGGFLRTFEFKRSLSWAIGLMKRYTAGEVVTNGALGRAICPKTRPDGANGRMGMEVAGEVCGAPAVVQPFKHCAAMHQPIQTKETR